jgi:hypothetical protein
MTQFTQDTVAIQDAEARGTRCGYRGLGISGRPALVFCQHFMGPPARRQDDRPAAGQPSPGRSRAWPPVME